MVNEMVFFRHTVDIGQTVKQAPGVCVGIEKDLLLENTVQNHSRYTAKLRSSASSQTVLLLQRSCNTPGHGACIVYNVGILLLVHKHHDKPKQQSHVFVGGKAIINEQTARNRLSVKWNELEASVVRFMAKCNKLV